MPLNPNITTYASIVMLKAYSSKTTKEITLLTGILINLINWIYVRAI
jgi:hypothetical protein